MASPTDTSLLTPPAAVDLVLAFCNTHAGGQGESLTDGAAMRAWLLGAGFGKLEATDADAACARELRDAIQVVMLAHTGEEQEPGSPGLKHAEAYLRRAAGRYPMVTIVGAEGVSLRPTQDGVPGAFTSVLAAITELAQSGAWSRVKACRNPICHFGFYDTSRNSSASFHSAQCRSMVSMRAFRERKKAAK